MAALCLAGLSVPALAGNGGGRASEEIERGFAAHFDDPVLRAKLKAQQARMERRHRELQSAEARVERQRSQTAYRGLRPGEVRELLEAKFPDFPGSHAPRVLNLREGERVRAYRGRRAALVQTKKGKTLLAQSAVPLRSRKGSGKLATLDLELVERDGAFMPSNPLVSVRIPKRLGEGIALERSGVGLRMGSESSDIDPQRVGNAVLYSDVSTDTDLIATPTPSGVSVSLQLRSADSPGSFPVHLDLPAGAALRLLDADDARAHRGPPGAAEIVRGSRRLATISPPQAVDAQGQQVPAEYRVHGETLTIQVDHHGGDFALPVLVDPVVEEYYPDEFADGGWDVASSNAGFRFTDDNVFDGPGLWIWADASRNYAYGDWALAFWQAPRQSYVERVDLFSVVHRASSTCLQEGIWAPTRGTWDTGTWQNWMAVGSSPWWYTQGPGTADACAFQADDYKTHCVGRSCEPDGSDPGGTPRNGVVFGMWNYLQGRRLQTAVGGVRYSAMYLYDNDTPSLSLSHSGLHGGWMDSSTPSVTASASDPGLGMGAFTLYLPGNEPYAEHPCDGDRYDPCPVGWSHTFNYSTADLPEGRYDLAVEAEDIIGHVAERTWTVKIDHTPPELDLSGELADLDGQALDSDAALQIDARDGDSSDPDEDRSGVERIEVRVDGEMVPAGVWSGFCAGSGACPDTGSLDYAFSPAALGLRDGRHTITVVAEDDLDHRAQETIEVIVDRNTPSVQITHQGLSSGWMEDGQPSVSVSASDRGNAIAPEFGAGVKSIEVVAPTTGDPDQQTHTLPCEGTVADRCPESASKDFNYQVDQMPEGANEVVASAADAMGHQAEESWQVKVDRSPPELELSGELAGLDGQGLDSDAGLHVEARDGDSSSPEDDRSGVKRIEVRVDGQTVVGDQLLPSWTSDCGGAGGCPDTGSLDYVFSPAALGLRDGRHTITVVAEDDLGHRAQETVEVIVDRNASAAPTVTHQSLPGGWTDSAQPAVSASASDRGNATAPEFGTGVQSFELTVPGEDGPDTQTETLACEGTIADRCPESASKSFGYATSTMPEGVNDITVTASDAMGHQSPETTWQLKFDRSPPDLELSGELSDGDAVDQDANVNINAQDGDPTDPQTHRSGVKRVEVFVDAQTQPDGSWTQTCDPDEGCPASFDPTYTFSPSQLDLKDGRHTIKVVASDQLGHDTEQTITVIVDRTAPSRPDIAHEGLPSGWTDDANPRYSASSSDRGTADPPEYGTGVQSLEFEFPTDQGPSSQVTSYPCQGTVASRCPETGTQNLTYETDDLAEGIDELSVTASDALGHASAPATFTVKIDRTGPDVAPSGQLKDLENQTLWDEGTFALHVQATDGDAQNPRSGVERIEISVDGEVKATNAQPCATDSCAMSLDWTLQAADYSLGSHQIAVSAKDALGHVTSQTWNVTVGESGTIVLPTAGERTSRRLVLQAKANRADHSGVRFEFRRADTQAWQTIPTAQVRDANDSPIAAWPVALSDGKSPALFWDLPPTPGIDNQDGDVQVRAVMTGGPGGISRAVKTKLDRKGIDANHAAESIGPGSVDLLTGNLSISSGDVSIPSFGTSLTLTRTHNSRDVAAGSDGMFGPGWLTSISVDDAASDYVELVESQTDAGATQAKLTDSAGVEIRFTDTGGGFQAPAEFKDLKLTKTGTQYELVDLDGNATVFQRPASAESYRPVEVRQPGSANKTTYLYERADGVTRIKRVLAPVPQGVSCDSGLQAGCRALELVYAGQTTATGNGASHWGDFHRRLKAVKFTAYDPQSAGMRTTEVANYSYDASGRLRAAWDPRITPALKVTYDYDTQGHLTELTPPGEEPWTMRYAAISGDPDTGRLASVSRPALPGTATTTLVYDIPLAGSGAPYAMGAGDVAAWGQSDRPTDATAIFSPDQIPSDPPTSYSRAAVHYLNARGREVNEAAPGGHITTTEYDTHGNVLRELTAANRARALAAGDPAARSRELDTQRTYSSDGLELVDELGPLHEVTLNDGQKVQARKHTLRTYDEGAPAGGPYHLPTTTKVGTKIAGQAQDADVRVTKTDYSGQSNLGWQLRKPTATIIDAASGGMSLISRTLYDSVTALATESRMPANPDGGDARSKLIRYYTAGSHPTDPECANKPAWANLPCKERPVTQPTTPGLPELPVTTYTYDYLGQTATNAETAAGVTRTTTRTYDLAGRLITESVSSPIGTALPAVSTTYDPQTGKPTTTSTTQGAITRTITRSYDRLGRQTSYRDADGITSTTAYDLLGRPVTSSDGRGTQTRTYDPTSGLLTDLDDSAAGHFSATYDPDGQLVTQTYPNGLEARTTYDETGSPVRLTYDKQSNCGPDGCRWFDFRVSESIHGQWRTHTSELSSQTYAYDDAGRLTQVKDTVPASGCTTRSYAYDRNSNRTSFTTRPPAVGGACDTTSPATPKTYTHDAADRLYGSGYSYDQFGRITTAPAADTGGQSPLTSTYYVNDLVETETQAGVTTAFILDPARRPRLRETRSQLGSRLESIHYADDSDSPSWTAESQLGLEFAVTRNIEGLDGNLIALHGSRTGTILQIANLHGDIIAEASPDEKVVKPLATFEQTEFGVPRNVGADGAASDTQRSVLPGRHRRYGWLGAKQRPAELESGIIQMGVRSYIPTLGRFTAADPVEGGSANDYDYANADPVNQFDLDGNESSGPSEVEKQWCRLPHRWRKCLRAQRLSQSALSHQRKWFRGRPGAGNAFRHCAWSGTMTVEFGTREAKGFGDRHEDYEGNSPRQRKIDYHNNHTGRRVGRYWRSKVGIKALANRTVMADCRRRANRAGWGLDRSGT